MKLRKAGTMTNTVRFPAVSLSLLFLLFVSPIGAGAQDSSRKAAAAGKQVPVGKPFTMERLLARLQDVSKREYTEGALIRKISQDGVDFWATAENLNRVREAGGSPALVALVRRLAPTPPPPPPAAKVPDPEGDIEVTCQPAECEVSIGARPAAATAGGKLMSRGIAPGVTPVKVVKEGFLPLSTTANVVDNRTAVVNAHLEPNATTLESWGSQWKDKAVAALGGAAALTEARALRASGEVTVWGENGKPFISSLELLLRPPGTAFFRTRSGKASILEVELLPVLRVKTNFSEEEARELEAGFRLFSTYQLSVVFDRIAAERMRITAGTGPEFYVESSTGRMRITLDHDGRPAEIREDAPIGPQIRAMYSQYRLQGRGYFPMKMFIIWQGSSPRGVSVQLRDVDLQPDSKWDDRYRIKTRSRQLLGFH